MSGVDGDAECGKIRVCGKLGFDRARNPGIGTDIFNGFTEAAGIFADDFAGLFQFLFQFVKIQVFNRVPQLSGTLRDAVLGVFKGERFLLGKNQYAPKATAATRRRVRIAFMAESLSS